MSDPLRVFIGWDSREPIAYDVAAYSIRKRASIAVDIRPIRLPDLLAAGLYARPVDPLASTEFTYSRFFTPYLAGFKGWALFVDCDFLFLSDIAGLMDFRNEDKAVYCVHHDYQPTESIKMDGKVQTSYPRKNWSSLMWLNCGHSATRALTPDVVNSQAGAFLHRLQWARDDEIGELDYRWNFLEGHYRKPDSGTPKRSALHARRPVVRELARR